ncbi:hypothetical protein HTZ78_17675 (plasmid) [Synechocystis sp. PCC 7338]|nr:hypothetical protein HTZ78_17675 [Synechocystis sp. PCC 7338]
MRYNDNCRINQIREDKMTTFINNSLFTIQPYWLGRTWVFDAPNLGVMAEPFVAGTNIVLTQLAQTRLGIEPSEGAKFQLIFSAQGFPGLHLSFRRQEPEFNGYWYLSEAQDWAWFSPAMTSFFSNGYPEELYLQVLR